MNAFYVIGGGATVLTLVFLLLWRISASGARMIEEQRAAGAPRARRTSGVVVGNAIFKNSAASADDDTHVPVVRFQIAENARYQITGTIGSHPPAYSVGDVVTIGYLPERPRDARILTFFGLYWLPLMFSVFSAATAFRSPKNSAARCGIV